MTNQYVFAVASYVPDKIRDERVNIGVIILSGLGGRCRFENKNFKRVLAIDPDADLKLLAYQSELWGRRVNELGSSYVEQPASGGIAFLRETLGDWSESIRFFRFEYGFAPIRQEQELEQVANWLFEQYVASPSTPFALAIEIMGG